MKKNKINIILITICILLCICIVIISIIIPKQLIQISNDEAVVKYGNYEYYVYGDEFYAEIENIKASGGTTYIYVKGLDINDINHRGNYHFIVYNDTKLMWHYTKIGLSDLKVGQTLSITSVGTVRKSTGLLNKVTRINILNDEI